jgi:DNA-binding GntR family transcriptional regulator
LGRARKNGSDDELWGLAAPRIVARMSLHEQTTTRLRDLIVKGTLAPGARLVEVDLCRRLAISRTPLREAFKVLASEGLVHIHPNRGASVTRMTPAETIELFEVIAQLEAMGAATAAQRMSEDNLAKLSAMHEQLAAWYAQGRRHDYFELNQRIHRAVVALSGNRILVDTHARLIARARRSRYQAILFDARWTESVEEHGQAMAAFIRRDPAAVADIWRRHVLRTGEVIAEREAAADHPARAETRVRRRRA